MEDLRQLIAAYFHQDWSDECSGRWESAVDDFARREPDRFAGAAGQIDALLHEKASNDALSQALDGLGNFRDAGSAPDAYRTWLRQIAHDWRD